MYTSQPSSPLLSRRATPSDSMILTIVIMSIGSALLLVSTVWLSFRLWKKVIARRNDSQMSEKPQNEISVPGRKQSDWARKNSNVLWSMYIEEDDLKAQFALSPKSRLFSIGSVSTVDGRCPLDRRMSHANPVSQHKVVEDSLHNAVENVPDMRIRTPYEHQTTPTKNLPRARASSQPSKHRYTSSFEGVAKRKQSLPAQQIEDNDK